MIGRVEIPLSVTMYWVLFLVPKGLSFSIREASRRVFNLFDRILVAIFSLEDLNSLNQIFYVG